MRRCLRGLVTGATAITTVVALAACSGSGSPAPGAAPAASSLPAPPATWAQFRRLDGVVDLAARGDGTFVVAANGRLLTMDGGGVLSPFARGAGGYQTATGTEPYLVTAGGCFGNGTSFAIEPAARPAVIEITPAGRARQFASLPAGRMLSGIAYDATGRFGHRLLVTAETDGKTTVFGISCDGRLSVVAGGAPPMEGGIAVAPASFGSFGGDLIAPNETSGRIYAVSPSGAVVTLADSGLPAGGDIGVESAGFVPARASAAYLADRYSPGNRHPGDNVILRLSATELARAGIRTGDLLVATEGGTRTVDVRCAAVCTVRYVAAGPAIAHGEGHIAFTP